MWININKERINTSLMESINKKGLSFTLASGRVVKVLNRTTFLNLIIASGDKVDFWLEITEGDITEMVDISAVFKEDTINGKIGLKKIENVFICHQGGPGGEYHILNKKKKELKVKSVFKSEDIDLYDETKTTTDKIIYPFSNVAKSTSQI